MPTSKEDNRKTNIFKININITVHSDGAVEVDTTEDEEDGDDDGDDGDDGERESAPESNVIPMFEELNYKSN